jgi:hypothetical protein
VDAGRRRAVVLLVTSGTFGAALVGLYALTGLWPAHDTADRWAVAIAFAVAASGAVDKALSPWPGHAPPATAPRTTRTPPTLRRSRPTDVGHGPGPG